MVSCLEVVRQALPMRKAGVEELILVHSRFEGKRAKTIMSPVCLVHPTLARSTAHNS